MAVIIFDSKNTKEICRATDAEFQYIGENTISHRNSLKQHFSDTHVLLEGVSYPSSPLVSTSANITGITVSRVSQRIQELELLLAAVLKTLGGGMTLTYREVVEADMHPIQILRSADNGNYHIQVMEQ